MWHSFLAYSKYLVKSKSKYDIHSPFVYDFLTKAIEKPLPKEYTKKLTSYRKSLLKDERLIHVTDFGAGSRVFKSKHREISAVAKYAGISKSKAKLLQKILIYFQPKSILELGTSVGIGTACMRIALPYSNIITLEGCPDTAAVAESYFDTFQFKNIQLRIGEFSKILPGIYKNQSFDLIYFDGNHQKEPTISYFIDCLKSVHNDTILIFDDIHWSKEMEEAWNYIKKHQKVSVSIDLYHMGLIFFRKEQVKQDFILR